MFVVRPAGPADFDTLMELAVLSGRGFTSLPEDEPTLRERLELSAASFEGAVAPPEAERFFVYGRGGKPCRRCRAPIETYQLGDPPRWTRSCPGCQARTEDNRSR